jgi:hypothetical protein
LALGTLALTVGYTYGINAQTGRVTARKIVPQNASPPVRANHAMIYDPQGDRLVVFGGSGNGGVLNDIWAFSRKDRIWKELTPKEGSAPAPRLTPTAVYDAKRHRMVIYSGQGTGFFNDTWAFDLEKNIWTELKTDRKPAPRYGTILAYDSNRHAAVTFAGFTSEGGRFDDTWSFSLDSDSWQDLGPDGPRPRKRCLHMGAYDSDGDRLFIYGGQSGGDLGDLWAFDLRAKTWRELTPSAKPAARRFASMVYDSSQKRLLVFGGRGSEVFGDLWAFDTQQERWVELTIEGEKPTSRDSHSAVWMPNRVMYLFGGSAGGLANDLWEVSFG